MRMFKWGAFAISCLFLTNPANLWADYSTEASRFVYPNYSKKISMDFKEAELEDVLKIFSQQSGMNFIAASELKDKKVTLFLDNIPVEEALEKILSANGLQYEMQPGSDIFVVKPLPGEGQVLVTRIYHLKYASVPSSKLNSTISINGSSQSSTPGAETTPTTAVAAGSAATSSSGGGILSAVRGVLSKYGKVMEDPRTNSLIVTDMESQFTYIESLIARLDIDVPQIMIEVEMLDVSKLSSDQIGVKFSEQLAVLTGAKRATLYPWDLNTLLNKGKFAFTGDTPEYTAGLLDTSVSKIIVQFLETKTDTKNLARPRLITLNNQTAQIQISTNEAIGLTTQTTSSGGSADTTKEAERVQTGVFLLVTPQANLTTGEITMAVAPKVIQARTGATFGDQTFKDPEERGSQQMMKVRAGETIVMGGLLRTDDTKTITKLPILGDLPVVGRAFRHTSTDGSERELLIFITPTIITDTGKFQSLPEGLSGREQKIPQSRQNQIDKELKSIEQQRY